jgi:RNA polymerase sigma factor (sigma-70 family)
MRRHHDDPSSGGTGAASDGALVGVLRGAPVRSEAEVYEQARTELLVRHRGAVEAVCRRWLGGDLAVDDAVQETFVRALSRLGELRDPDRFGPWVRAIAASVCVDVHRDRRRTRPDEAPAAGLACPDVSPAEAALRAEEARLLHEHLGRLGERDRTALWLRDGHGAPVSEVADRLGLTEGSARVLLHRARRRLRDSLDVRGLAAPLAAMAARWRVRSPAALVVGVGVLLPAPSAPPAPAAPPPPVTALPQSVADRPEQPAVATPPDPPAPPAAAATETVAAPAPTETVAPPAPEPSPRSPRGPVVTRTPPAQRPVAEVAAGSGDEDVLEGLVYLGDLFGGTEPSDESHDEAPGEAPGGTTGETTDGEASEQEQRRSSGGLPVGVERRPGR